MNLFLRLFLCAIISGLISCVPKNNNALNINELKQCQLKCVERFDSCKTSCVDNCFNCSRSSFYSTQKNYSRYLHEKIVEGQIVSRRLKSYRDPLQCRKTTCNCSADLVVCKQNCTGIIQKRLQARPFCA